MTKSLPRSPILAVLSLLLAAVVTVPPATAQSSSQSDDRSVSSPGRYRAHGRYRSQGRHHHQSGQAWKPSFHHQNKFFQLKPRGIPFVRPFNTALQSSRLERHKGGGHSFNIAPVLPAYAVYVPYQFEPEPEPPPPPPPQVVVVQVPQAQAPPPPPVAYEPPPPNPPPPPVSRDPGELALAVHPADARVYVNDLFVGTGESLEAKGEPLVMKGGVYVLEAEHPDYGSQRLIFAVAAHDTVYVAIDLTSELPGRRARVAQSDEADFLLN